MLDRDLWSFVVATLGAGTDLCLVTMVEAVGSGPNRPGARVVVTADGRQVGTVGGGSSEHDLVQQAALALVALPRPAAQLVRLDHGSGGGGRCSGMICSGSQVFVLLCLSRKNLETVRRIEQAVLAGLPGILSITAAGLAFVVEENGGGAPKFVADIWCYTEPMGHRDRVTLVGGGHISLALSPLLVGLGMQVVVLDNRAGLSTMRENSFASELRIVDFAAIGDEVPTGDHSYVCIMTAGHRHDLEVLAQLVGQPRRYLGMMGSKAKVARTREALLAQGVPAGALALVHAPIGLAIGSNTPAEIAISIAAEIVAVRNGSG